MNIPDNKVLRNKNDGVIIDDIRIFKGMLTLAREWGSESLSEPNDADDIDELLFDFADEAADIKAKYEVDSKLNDAKNTPHLNYQVELNALFGKYRVLLFKSFMDYISDEISLDLMLDIMRV